MQACPVVAKDTQQVFGPFNVEWMRGEDTANTCREQTRITVEIYRVIPVATRLVAVNGFTHLDRLNSLINSEMNLF